MKTLLLFLCSCLLFAGCSSGVTYPVGSSWTPQPDTGYSDALKYIDDQLDQLTMQNNQRRERREAYDREQRRRVYTPYQQKAGTQDCGFTNYSQRLGGSV